ncbi:AAA family ATPase [Pseudoalteromonas sp. H71]|uniref:AAA family ATPase n=1 Tax=Pseudoalteromonas sp. H71 TaxID=1348395 RepID=UPI000730861B|nr:AAA family ATPase [Pseudoalteromonas sp. H71]KTD91862.1 hypothetical protein ATS71_06230 [Pseudoalteromonas sp. H71]
MDSIRIQGLKSLKDTGVVELKPLTILLGENSAGKSTFLRTFPLIKQSLASSTRGSILWFGSYVDFGDYEHALSKYSTDGKIKFGFGFDLSSFKNAHHSILRDFLEKSLLGKYYLNFNLKKDKKGNEKVSELDLDYFQNQCSINFDIEKNKIEHFAVNGHDFSEYFQETEMDAFSGRANLLPILRFKKNGLDSRIAYRFRAPYVFINESIYQEISKRITPFTRKGTNISDILQQVVRCDVSSTENFYKELINSSNAVTWKKKIVNIKNEENQLSELMSLVIAIHIPTSLFVFNQRFCELFESTNYIAPLRANAERYYRTQNLSVDQVDHQGSNLPMFIDNLSETQKKNFQEWMTNNFGFFLDARSSTGHLSLYLHYKDSDTDYNVTDMGFGFSQILPIITQLWFTTYIKSHQRNRYSNEVNFKMLIIEQPELHLHPRIQSKLINVFIRAIELCKKDNIDLKIMIETHSETIVNCIGRAISKNKLSKGDTSIIVFDKKKPDEETAVKISTYDDDGCLLDWPWGFFDTE